MTMEALFREWRITPPILMQLTSNESIKQAVIANLGIAFISLRTVADELRSGRLVALKVDELPLIREWPIVHLSARVLSPAAETFRHFVLKSGAEFLRRHFETSAPPTASAATPALSLEVDAAHRTPAAVGSAKAVIAFEAGRAGKSVRKWIEEGGASAKKGHIAGVGLVSSGRPRLHRTGLISNV